MLKTSEGSVSISCGAFFFFILIISKEETMVLAWQQGIVGHGLSIILFANSKTWLKWILKTQFDNVS